MYWGPSVGNPLRIPKAQILQRRALGGSSQGWWVARQLRHNPTLRPNTRSAPGHVAQKASDALEFSCLFKPGLSYLVAKSLVSCPDNCSTVSSDEGDSGGSMMPKVVSMSARMMTRMRTGTRKRRRMKVVSVWRSWWVLVRKELLHFTQNLFNPMTNRKPSDESYVEEIKSVKIRKLKH